MDAAVPARLHAAADQDLPPPRRPRDGRHGRADPDQGRPRGERGRAGQGARRQAARGDATATTAPGWRTRPGRRSRARSSTRTCRARTSSTGSARTCRSRAATCCALPEGTRTEAGLRHNIRVGVQYLAAWLGGSGCVPLYNLMEDAATAEISRAQVWQWLRHRRARSTTAGALDRRALPRGARRGDGRVRARGRRRALRRRPLRRGARAVRAPVTAAELRRVPDPARLRAAARRRARQPMLTIEQNAHARPRLARDHATATRRPRVRRPPLGGHHPPLHAGGRRAAARLRRASSTRSPSWARERLWELLHTRGLRPRARRADRQPGGAEGARRPQGDLPLAAGRSRPTPTSPARCTPTRASTPPTASRSVVRRINSALQRADQIEHAEGKRERHWFAPIVADAEAGFGGPLNAFELMKAMIEAGAAGVHFEDQLASREEVRPHGRQGAGADQRSSSARWSPRAWPPTSWACRRCSSPAPTPTAPSCSPRDVDERDQPFMHRRAHRRGLLPHHAAASRCAIARGLAYAPYADLVWCETSTPDLDEAAASPRPSTRSSRASCWPTTARRRSTGRRTSTTRRSPSSSASSAPWATSSSSSPWPASTR